MKPHSYQQVKFLTSAASLKQLPPDEGIEIAFAGRSNAGKSSTLNIICEHKQLARISKTPGRTQLINLFELDEQRRLVDLPGYGYAKVPDEIKARWQATLAQYLETRTCLRGIFLIMDIRHPLKDLDQNFIAWSNARNLPLHILLNKADKLSRGAAQTTLLAVQRQLQIYPNISCQLFSAFNKSGLEQAKQILDQWFAFDEPSSDS